MSARRLPEGPDEAILRDRPVTIEVDSKLIHCFEGDTVGSAMAVGGITITGRSFKYHRPRGLQCMTGNCPNCLVTVDGIPNVRACTEPVRGAMKVVRQNAWPSVGADIHGWLNFWSFMMPPGFYYKVFHRPRWAWHAVEPLIRSKAGLGFAPEEEDHRTRERISLHADVLVVGGGPAGLAAATEAASAGANVVLLEQRREAGGHLLGEPGGRVRAAGLVSAATDVGVKLLSGTAAFGVFDGPIVAGWNPDALYRIRARHVVFATGAIEQPAVFPDNDLPGIMLSSAVDLLVNRFRVLPGRKAVVLTASDGGYGTAESLQRAGASVRVVDLRGEVGPTPTMAGLAPVLGATILRAHGRRRVRAVEVGPPGASGGRKIPCDLVVLAGFAVPSTNLLSMTGAKVEFDDHAQAFLPVDLPPTVHAAGAVAGSRTTDGAITQGRLAGLEAAAAVGHGSAAASERVGLLRLQAAADGDPVVLPPETGLGKGKQFACLCMDVTNKELKFAVEEGFDSMELLKRYTTITMGPCQGKGCMLASQRLCGKATGHTLAETRPTTARPPWTPVELGTLAGERRSPRKETTMHDVHVDAGAEFMWAADWRRPHHYSTPGREVEAVRQRVGLIDVSTLGKFRVKGPQASDLLERLYPNRFGDMKIGRVRYGAMLNDEGVILDDGTVCRLTEDEFFVTVTTGNTAALERWMTWWLADWGLDLRVLNVTAAYAAVNLGGPDSRKVMEKLTDADVSKEAVPYMGCVPMDVAGVPSLVLRIGFVGELSYEIHFPSMYGEHVWDATMEAGEEFGIEPFGLEAQRILRLEKQHVLVGQDTDAESDPYEAGLGWMVKLDKPDFLGKRALIDLEAAGPAERLVGWTADPSIVPPEGSSVVHEGVWVGRVTSARRSATTGKTVGLAWVPAGWAQEGTHFDIQFGTVTIHATVALKPFYDPEGTRLRS